MKRFFTTLLAMTLVAGVAMSGSLKEKEAQKAPIEVASGYVPALSPSSPWTPVAPWVASTITLKSAQFTSANVVWADGANSAGDYLFRSTDGGMTWSQTTIPDGNSGGTNIAASNDSVAIYGLYTGEILRTIVPAWYDIGYALYMHPPSMLRPLRHFKNAPI